VAGKATIEPMVVARAPKILRAAEADSLR